METEIILRRNYLLVRLKGELDHHSSARLRQEIEEKMQQSGCRNIIFNLEGLTFMDSSGVGLLLGRFRQVREMGGQMAICHVPRTVYKVLEISGIPKIVSMFDREEEALLYLGQGPGQRRGDR
ncbi:MAG TPA: anti-sigma F factor antagonist [Bacillota bacterium]|jgi:stage II sporulation protein AA (anti-sigma F factor antagonist)|nr:anti-sigma F factor antagonist [Bacillota bacterium]HOB87261.1 anti-sigma F factor antagonist [Bacillota bacterium]HOP68976.1 anti-sigma F factor antagonist [Bacillota bacterium]HPT34867.1 anti-sigma F factor antagonist [Bacillota bacterium]HPZ64151.1 anti-sigma F factor antagonist [Bacillota bacterium]